MLAIDAGNTRIKWGLDDGSDVRDGHVVQGWSQRGALNTADIAGSQVFSDLLKASVVDCVVVSNVAGSSVAAAIKDQIYFLRKPITFISAEAHQCGVVNHYKAPAQLGSDRWAALVAAHVTASGAPRAQLVVMAGTALTVDALTADGHFLGGIIVPGLMLMQRALNRGTAQLPSEPGSYQTFPTATVHAIGSGAVEACAGAVARMYTHLSTQVGVAPHCIGSGGAMQALAPHLPFPVLINDNLVLDGIRAITEASTTVV